MVSISRFSFIGFHSLNMFCIFFLSKLLILKIKERYLKEMNDRRLKMTVNDTISFESGLLAIFLSDDFTFELFIPLVAFKKLSS